MKATAIKLLAGALVCAALVLGQLVASAPAAPAATPTPTEEPTVAPPLCPHSGPRVPTPTPGGLQYYLPLVSKATC